MKNALTCIFICALALCLPFLNQDSNVKAENNSKVDLTKIENKKKQLDIRESIYELFPKSKSLKVVTINNDCNEIYIEIESDNKNSDKEKTFNILKSIETTYPDTFNTYTFAYTNKNGSYLFKADYLKENLSSINWNDSNLDTNEIAKNVFSDSNYK